MSAKRYARSHAISTRRYPNHTLTSCPRPAPACTAEIALMVEHYRATQSQQVKTLAEHAPRPGGPCLHRARVLLHDGKLLDPIALGRLPENAERDAAGRREQDERGAASTWPGASKPPPARAGGAGPLGRLTHHAQDYYPQLDQERLRVCGSCAEMIYPRAREAGSSYHSRPVALSLSLLPRAARHTTV